MAASIADVAARAGVSVATVSRALRGLPNVAPSTRTRVLEAASELDYVADPNASRLAAGQTRTIGVVVPLLTQWFFTQVAAGAESILATRGYELLLYNVGGPDGRERFLTDLPFRKRVDGLIVIELPLSEPEQQALRDAGVPVAYVGGNASSLPSVTIDNVGAAALATGHLTALGHERIGLISGLPDDPLEFPVPVERRHGYQQALRAASLPIAPELELPGNFSFAGGAEATTQLLGLAEPPTAVFAESDEMAVGALKAAREAGVAVPEDFSVIGFDDNEVAEFVDLTTVHQPVVEHGEVAAELLLAELSGAGSEEPTRVVLPTALKIRGTTGPMKRRAGGLEELLR